MSNNKLEGKVAIITGGASGIGKATACVFADHGARMVVIADIQDELGEQVAAIIGSQKCRYIHCDVTDEEQVKAMVEWTVQNYGQLDIMFSNAGIIRSKNRNSNSVSDQNVLDLDLAAFDHLFAVNVRGMAACVKHAGRAMVERRVRGSIVCTASVAASCGGDTDTDYFMSKHAVVGLVRSASHQLGAHGIRVNSVSPFVVAMTSLTHHLTGTEAEEARKVYDPETKLKGVVVKAKHVADAVLFLASQDSEAVTGHDMVVDGGFLLK
ncbi:short-chain dehydrogenase reductase 5 [Hibiscus trionum]|uniref:Short-chain dehydrogenase reductase 5 n=1 Tax=Hibiscus trionum TaxID=183268 RepID=A0A9W7HAB1_HIBTR|nr:short-chain dehydrogenase reductase 5 [Hibiscus trionum]